MNQSLRIHNKQIRNVDNNINPGEEKPRRDSCSQRLPPEKKK